MLAAVYTIVASASPLATGPYSLAAVVPINANSIVPKNSTSSDTTNVLEYTDW
jgi:hypothetical protein